MVICTAMMIKPTAITLASVHSRICNIVTIPSKIASMFPNIIFFFSFLKFANFLYIIYMKPDEPKFLTIPLFFFSTFFLNFPILCLLEKYYSATPSAFDTAFVFFTTAAFNFFFAWKLVKPALSDIFYDGENYHLFSKYIAILDMLITVAVAFLIGIIPAFCDRNSIAPDSYAKYVANVSSVWLGCTANIYRAILVHTMNIWVRNHTPRITWDATKHIRKQ